MLIVSPNLEVEQYQNYRLESLVTQRKQNKFKRKYQDTIGGILISQDGECWIATSSGGPWFKESGRIGSSVLKGAGFDIL